MKSDRDLPSEDAREVNAVKTLKSTMMDVPLDMGALILENALALALRDPASGISNCVMIDNYYTIFTNK